MNNPTTEEIEPVFMKNAIMGFKNRKSIAWCIYQTAFELNMDVDSKEWFAPFHKLRVLRCYWPTQTISIYIAELFEPVSNAIYKGLPDEAVIDLWQRTPEKKSRLRKSIRKEQAARGAGKFHTSKIVKAAVGGVIEYKKGGPNTDWKITK